MPKSTAARIASEMRKTQKETGELDQDTADQEAAVRAESRPGVGFGAKEHWTAWEFPDGSRLILNNDTGKFRVPQSQRDRNIADAALYRRKRELQQQNRC